MPTDLVVFAAGIRPRDELAATMGLDCGERGGVVVDDRCRTVDERVWAIGECAAVRGRCHGLVAPGYRMADSVARQLLGQDAEPFDDTDTPITLKLLGVNIATFGVISPHDDRVVEAVYTQGTSRYVKLLLREGSGDLVGGILAGDTGSLAGIGAFVGRRPPPDLEQLVLP